MLIVTVAEDFAAKGVAMPPDTQIWQVRTEGLVNITGEPRDGH
jgi:hypothetical protein